MEGKGIAKRQSEHIVRNQDEEGGELDLTKASHDALLAGLHLIKDLHKSHVSKGTCGHGFNFLVICIGLGNQESTEPHKHHYDNDFDEADYLAPLCVSFGKLMVLCTNRVANYCRRGDLHAKGWHENKALEVVEDRLSAH